MNFREIKWSYEDISGFTISVTRFARAELSFTPFPIIAFLMDITALRHCKT